MPSHEMLPGWAIPEHDVLQDVELPPQLTLLYHPPIELESVTQALQQLLAEHGCQLEIRYYSRQTLAKYRADSPSRSVAGR